MFKIKLKSMNILFIWGKDLKGFRSTNRNCSWGSRNIYFRIWYHLPPTWYHIQLKICISNIKIIFKFISYKKKSYTRSPNYLCYVMSLFPWPTPQKFCYWITVLLPFYQKKILRFLKTISSESDCKSKYMYDSW